jgi:hypothetical protein
MKFDGILVRRAFGAVMAIRLLLTLGCTNGEPSDADADMHPATEGEAGAGGENGNEGEEGMAGNGESGAGMAGGPGPAAPSFGEVYDILAATCGGGRSGCHITGMSSDLALPDAQLAYDHLVNVDSVKCPGELLVVPGDAEASLLVTVLEGGAECVKAMPLGRDPLSAEQIATIRAWIDAGALAP